MAVNVQAFTLVELLAVLTIAGILLIAAIPSTVRLYESIQYRQAVRDVIVLLGSARYRALTTGAAQDVEIDPRLGELMFDDDRRVMPGGITLVVRSAKEVNKDDKGIIRFYPEGGSSGGDVDLERGDADSIRVSVDWLMGGISHARNKAD